MEYRKFVIENYRAITGPLEINLTKTSLMPIIGVNECGKTTILSAIFAFDHTNDTLNEGRHMKDIRNLYGTAPGIPKISAEISLDVADFEGILEDIEEDIAEAKPSGQVVRPAAVQTQQAGASTANVTNPVKAWIPKYRRKRRQFPSLLVLTRDLASNQYSFRAPGFINAKLNHLIGKEIARNMPFILFFDDFRDSVDETIEIPPGDPEPTGWLSIVNQLFKKTDPNFSVYMLPKMEERQRKSVLAKVKRRLNETLTKEWQNFRLDDSDALEISIEFHSGEQQGTGKNYLKLEIIETDSKGDQHYFFIRDRSKGFFWFFNFVMKLEFNPKIIDDASATIYLLDEPGSYLHASAQSKLCRKLKQLSKDNRVIYCTHSHYLLDPEVIPFSSIKVAEKSSLGAVHLVSIHEHKGNITERRSAFQPIIDALQIKPIMVDLTQQKTLIVEGIYDFYALDLFRAGRNIGILPSVGASSIAYYVSLMIAWRVPYLALWDNDEAGRKEKARAEAAFGEDEAKRHFVLLPFASGTARSRTMEDLFKEEDLVSVRQALKLSNDASYEKTIAALHFASEKAGILSQFTEQTRKNFSDLYAALNL